MNQEIMQQLRAPFQFEHITAKIQVTNSDKSKGYAVFRLSTNAVQERLDTVVGSFDWSNEYVLSQDNPLICGLSLYNSERGDWITKYCGEDVKDRLADSFTQAAELWNIGRYLRQMKGIWVDIEESSGGYCVKDGQQGTLKSTYDKAVFEIFGNTAAQVAPADMGGKQEQQDTKSLQHPSEHIASEYDYKVRSVKQSGKNSQLLELVDKNGDVTAAYVKASDQGIKTGAGLNRVTLERKNSTYGEYNLIASYQIAA